MQIHSTLKSNVLQSIASAKNHPILARLAKEVAIGKAHAMCPHERYDRMHNKHNRN